MNSSTSSLGNTTRQKCVIEAILQRSARMLSAEEILSLAKREIPKLGLSTVYRSLRRLAKAGVIERMSAAGEAARYGVAAKVGE